MGANHLRFKMESQTPDRKTEGGELGSPVSAVAKSLLSNFMKASFSMSSLRDGISPEKECPGEAPATLPRRKHEGQMRHCHAKDKKDEFWEALQPDYNYLMDHGLIDTCKEAKGELFWDDEMDVGRETWSYLEFFAQHDRMCAWVEHMEMEVNKPEGVKESHLEQIKAFVGEIMLLNDQAHRLIRRYPSMSDEIHQRTDHLNGLWEALQHRVSPGESQNEKASLRREIACQMRLLRKWIRSIEEQLGPLIRRSSWEADEIEAKILHHQELQKQIESRGKAVLTVIKLCEKLGELNEVGGGGGEGEKHFRGGTQALRAATNLQKRFHALWLRSLEWQCWLEELRAAPQQHAFGILKGDDSESEGRGEEPYRKYPRLTGGCRKPAATTESAGGLRRSRDVGVAVGRDTVDKGIMAGEPRFAHRPPDHQDVGYSSENSAHLSNEESAGEFVRVYTYTSAKATSPRVLEVVMDGDCRPRKTPPRETSEDPDGGDRMNVSDAGPNCATYYFRHEDSDTDRRPAGRTHLNFGGEADAEDDRTADFMDSSDPEEYGGEEDPPERGRCPDGIHRLVSEAEKLVHRRGPEAEAVRTVSHCVDSSCDASGEYTSSNDSDTDSSSSTSSQDQKGSVIHLKMGAAADADTPVVPAVAGNGVASDPGNANGAVRMRTKKRRNGDRPWSVVESNKRPDGQSNLSHFSNSENALHHMAQCSSIPREFVPAATEGDSSSAPRQPRKSTTKRRGCRRADSNSEDKCRSLGSLRHSSSSETGRRKSSSSLYRYRSGTHSDLAHCESMDTDDHVVPGANDASSTTLLVDEENARFANTTDELSSLSEQAWDDYLDPPYLSEPYSEQGVDDEISGRIWDFDDDYRTLLECYSDGTSTPSFPAKVRPRQRQTSTRMTANARDSSVLDSESDFEDVNDVIEQHRKQLQITELKLKAEMEGDPSLPGRHGSLCEVLATCQTHLKCLRKVWKQLGGVRLEPPDLNLGVRRVGEELQRGWERLLMETGEHRTRLGELGRLQNEVKAFEQKVNRVARRAEDAGGTLADGSGATSAERVLKEQTACLAKVRQDLTNLNFKIRNFETRTGLEVGCLKEDVVALYRLWDRAQDAVNEKLVWIQSIGTAWQEYNEHFSRLNGLLKEDDAVLATLTSALENSPNAASAEFPAFSELHDVARVAELKKKLGMAARDLKCADPKCGPGDGDSRVCLDDLTASSDHLLKLLGDAPAAEEIRLNVGRMTELVEVQQEKCRELVLKMASALKVSPDEGLSEAGSDFGCREGRKLGKNRRKGRRTSQSSPQRQQPPSSSSGRLWRVLRAALPFQLAVVILFCFACLLEPHCCDSVNNLNLSLTPQLRYVRGPPPI